MYLLGRFGALCRERGYYTGLPWVYNTIQYKYNTIQYNTTQCNTTQRNATQHNTIQYNTIQYKCNTIQYNTIQYDTIQCNTLQYPATPCNYSVIITRTTDTRTADYIRPVVRSPSVGSRDQIARRRTVSSPSCAAGSRRFSSGAWAGRRSHLERFGHDSLQKENAQPAGYNPRSAYP